MASYNLRSLVNDRRTPGRDERITRSMSRTTAEAGPKTVSTIVPVTAANRVLMRDNMLSKEMQERQLISALNSNEIIPTPWVELLKGHEYDKLYPVRFQHMPRRIGENGQEDSGLGSDLESDQESNSTSEESLVSQMSRRKAIVHVERLNISNIVDGRMDARNIKSFQILKWNGSDLKLRPIHKT